MCERAVKRFSYTFSYIPDQCKTQQIYKNTENTVLKDPKKLLFVPNQYKSHEMNEKDIFSYPYIMETVLDCYTTQKILITYILLIKSSEGRKNIKKRKQF